MSNWPSTFHLPDLSRFDKNDVIALDTETTGLEVTDRPVGLSICAPNGINLYAAWGHELGGNNCSLEQVQEWCKRDLARFPGTVVFHNAPFDMRMMARSGLSLPDRIEDTNIVCALLNELEDDFTLDNLGKKYADVCKSDLELNHWCAEHFGGLPTRRAQAKNYWRAPGNIVDEYARGDSFNTRALFLAKRPEIDAYPSDDGVPDLLEIYRDETALLPILLKMHLAGVKVDVSKAERLKCQFEKELTNLQRMWQISYGNVSWNSTQQLAPLFEELGLPVNKTAKGNPSITADDLKVLDHSIARLIRRMKQLSHYSKTFIDNYILQNVSPEGYVHGEFHSLRNEKYGTKSGRFSSGGGLNLQNIPARDEEIAPEIRGLYIPISPEHIWIKADYSQIEYRFLAHYAGGVLRDSYVANPLVDFHEMAAELAGLKRRDAKTFNFAVVYGQGVRATAEQLGCSMDEAKEKLAIYHGRLPDIRPLYNRASLKAATHGYIVTWGGRRRRFLSKAAAEAKGWDVRRERGRFVGTHKALNAILQGSAADLIKKAMIRVANEIDWTDEVLHLTVHDELDLSAPKGEAGLRTARKIKELMQDFKCDVPIISDVETGPDWGHCEELAA